MENKAKEKQRAWYAANREKARERARARYAANPEKALDRMRARYAENPEKARARARERKRAWRAENPEKARERKRARYAANPEKAREYLRAWRAENPEKARARAREHMRAWRAENKIESLLRSRLKGAIRAAKAKRFTNTLELLGCTIAEFCEYIKPLFQPGMTWENHGRYTWHIDHIIPCAAFDLTKEEDQKKCFHYTNLQPLWAKDNLSKGARTPYPTSANTSPTNCARRLTANR